MRKDLDAIPRDHLTADAATSQLRKLASDAGQRDRAVSLMIELSRMGIHFHVECPRANKMEWWDVG